MSAGCLSSLVHLFQSIRQVLVDLSRLLLLTTKSRSALAAENLFLRKQLALFQERQVRPHLATDATRWLLVFLGKFFEWRRALVLVKPETLLRWHRKGFRLFWRWKSKPRGRPRLPADLQKLIRTMAADNPTWGEARIADELRLKLGLRVSPRTVRKYLTGGSSSGRTPDPAQRWLTFVRNHARAIVACDFFVVVTATFRVLYGFVLIEVGTRRIVHCNVTAHPTTEWTLQQFREAIPGEHPYRFVIHDRDRIYSRDMDAAVTAMGVKVLRTPVRSPRANSVCERLVGTIRRECLDFMIPFSERHLRRILLEWVKHYNQGRPHKSLGPGVPEPISKPIPLTADRHRLPDNYIVRAKAVLGGLHHEYRLEKMAA